MTADSDEWLWLNGRFCRAGTARLSVFDRGFLYGDGVFDTFRVYSGKAFGFDLHLQRLRRSAHSLGIRLPKLDWPGILGELIRRHSSADLAVRVTLSRGSGRGLLPPHRLDPTILIFATPIDRRIARWQRRGVAAISVPYSRLGCSADKHLGYLAAVLAKRDAARHVAQEGLFVDKAGYVLEGATSNLFVRLDRRWITPPPAGILAGVTRGLVMQLAASDGIRITERRLRISTLLRADEAFLTSSVAEIVPLIRVDAKPIGSGQPGSQTLALGRAYRQSVDRALRSTQPQ